MKRSDGSEPISESLADELDRAALARDKGDHDEYYRLHGRSLARLMDPGLSDPASTALPNLAPGTVLDEFVIGSELGRGGMGVVYAAEQTVPKRTVAIKVVAIRPSGRADSEALFEREIDVLARLRHEGIVHLYRAGRLEDGSRWFAMERIDGIELAQWAKSASVPERLRLFCRLCESIEHAHQRGVIHRDLKPSNILVERDGKPRVLDFGVAALLEGSTEDSANTIQDRHAGTLEWMSPEQVDGDIIDTLTDVHALGLILYWMLTGQHAFELRKADREWNRRAIRISAPRASDRLTWELRTICHQALAKKPSDRFSTVRSLRSEVERVLHGDPIEVGSPSGWYRTKKLVRRHRGLFSGIAFGIVALMLGLVMSLISLRRESAVLAQSERTTRYIYEGQGNTFDSLSSGFGDNAWNSVRTIEQTLDLIEKKTNDTSIYPHVRAVMAGFLGNALVSWNQYDRAIAVLQHALDLGKEAGDLATFEWATLYRNLGFALHARGNHVEARKYKTTALQLREECLEPTDPAMIQIRDEVMDLDLAERRLDDALALAIKNLEALRPTDQHRAYAIALRKLSVVHAERGELQDSQRDLLEALHHIDAYSVDDMELRVQLCSRISSYAPSRIDHAKFVAELESLSRASEEAGWQRSVRGVRLLNELCTARLSRDPNDPFALGYAIRAYRLTTESVGPNYSLANECRDAVLHGLWRQNRSVEKPTFAIEYVETSLSEYPTDQQRYLRAMCRYAGSLVDAGHFEAAKTMLDLVASDAADLVKTDRKLDIDLSHAFAQYCYARRDPEGLARHYEHAVAVAREGGDAFRADLRWMLAEYGSCAFRLGVGQRSCDLMAEAIAIADSDPGLDPTHFASYRGWYAESLIANGRILEGMREFEKAITAPCEVYGPQSPVVTDAEEGFRRAMTWIHDRKRVATPSR